MHGLIWFHALPCMESYDSMRGIAWKVCRPWFHAWNRMESYGSYASMHGIAWKPYEFGSEYYIYIYFFDTYLMCSLKVNLESL